jgi:Spy/CpxP family protein refolding chaperone
VNAWKVILATMVIFAAGALTGALLVRLPAHPRQGPGGTRLEFLRRVERELDLTPEERERIEKILKESQEQTRKIMEPVSPALQAQMQKTKEEFRQALTPEQQGRFDQLLKHSQRAREAHRPAGGVETSPLTNAPQGSPK